MAHGKASKEFIEKRFNISPERIFISPYTVDNAYFSNNSVPFRANRNGLKANKAYPEIALLYVGSFERRKAVMDLLKAFLLINTSYNAGIIIAGSGGDDAYERECKEFCKKNNIDKKVFFEGFIH